MRRYAVELGSGIFVLTLSVYGIHAAPMIWMVGFCVGSLVYVLARPGWVWLKRAMLGAALSSVLLFCILGIATGIMEALSAR